MLTNDRQQQILSMLSRDRSVTVAELSERLYASASTIRRDLTELEGLGYIKRVHGGAVLTMGSMYDAPESLRKTRQLEEKLKIASIAERFLRPSSTYFFDSSSTSAVLAPRLTDYPDVRIATNGTYIISSMQSTPDLSIISCGGSLLSTYGELTGAITLRSISDMFADVFFFSCAGISIERGATELREDNVAVKRAFWNNSRQRILLCDSTKFGKEFFYRLLPADEADYIITDKRPPDEYIDLYGDKLIYE